MKNPIEQLATALGIRLTKNGQPALGLARAERHQNLDTAALHKRRARNKAARRSRRINRIRAAR
ncbi:hypothetical protein [Microcella sp.]|uniref:hypothetical protein n=1 Tax=Microcella sp. TaxID=1913979 RepID=UPI00391DB51C